MRSLFLVPVLLTALALAAGASSTEAHLPPGLAPHFAPPAKLAGDGDSYRSPLLFEDGRPVRSRADWEKRRAEIRAAWHREMGAWPPLLEKPVVEVLATERRESFTQHRVRLPSAPGRAADGYLLLPDGPGPFPAVIVVFYEPETGIGKGQPQTDFALQLVRRGIAALSMGTPPSYYYPDSENPALQPLSSLAYAAANWHRALAGRPDVDPDRIGITGHSYGGKWALFASCLYDRFACAAWSDPGIVFDESRGNVNYWEPWYLGWETGMKRKAGIPTAENPRTGAYRRLVEGGRDLHELHALMAPRPFLVSGGSEDPPERWKALHHSLAVNRLLGHGDRVAMTNRPGHTPTPESNAVLVDFFAWALGKGR